MNRTLINLLKDKFGASLEKAKKLENKISKYSDKEIEENYLIAEREMLSSTFRKKIMSY